MLRRAFRRIAKSTKPQEKHSPTTSKGSSSVKPIQEQTMEEIANRGAQMILENLRNPANHSAYREYPHTKKK